MSRKNNDIELLRYRKDCMMKRSIRLVRTRVCAEIYRICRHFCVKNVNMKFTDVFFMIAPACKWQRENYSVFRRFTW